MKKILILSICLSLVSTLYAQKEGNVWMMMGFGLDFNSGAPELVYAADEYDHPLSLEGFASICDQTGNLLFYTNGDRIYNRDHDTMPGGGFLTPLQCWSTTQSSVILPVPVSDHLYYVFSLGFGYTGPPFSANELAYNIVDMSLEDGLGAVVDSLGTIFVEDSLSEKMTIVAIGNYSWLIVLKNFDNDLYAYPVRSDGLGAPVISHVSNLTAEYTGMAGELKFSIDGRKAVLANWQSPYLTVLDFSPETGSFSEPITLVDTVTPSYPFIYTADFSPDGSKLYTPHNGHLYQFNLLLEDAEAIIESKTAVSDDVYISPIASLKVGPDWKMYLKSHLVISVINFPNATASECGFEYGIFFPEDMGLEHFGGNFPNATPGAAYVPPSDPSNLESPYVNEAGIQLYPNPFSESLNIVINEESALSEYVVFLNDMLGRELYRYSGRISDINKQMQHVGENLFAGSYLLSIQSRIGDWQKSMKIVKQ